MPSSTRVPHSADEAGAPVESAGALFGNGVSLGSTEQIQEPQGGIP
jgi:hypothetical protein